MKMLMASWECFDVEVFVNTPQKKYSVMDFDVVPITDEVVSIQ